MPKVALGESQSGKAFHSFRPIRERHFCCPLPKNTKEPGVEIVEEMTSTELLFPVQEFDLPEADGIEQEMEWDMEEDYREMG